MFFANHALDSNILRRVPVFLLTLALYAHCGVSETVTPAKAKIFTLPREYAEKYTIKDEYFVSVTKRDGLQYDKEHMDTVHKYLLWIRQFMLAEEQISMPEHSWTGCGGTTTRAQYENQLTHSFCLRVPREADIRALLSHDLVESIEPHRRFQASGVQVCPPSWGLDRIDQPPNTKWNGVFSYSKTGKGVDVYIFDSGIKYDSSHFNSQFGEGLCYNNMGGACSNVADDHIGHGTILAEIIAGKRAGVAKDATLHPIKIFHTSPTCRSAVDFGGATYDLTKAVELLVKKECSASRVQHAAIALLPFTTLMLDTTKVDEISKSVKLLLDCNFVVIVSAGNLSNDTRSYSPAGIADVITVASFNKEGAISGFSNFGAKIDILGPGEGVEVTLPDSLRPMCPSTIEGTSAAAAFTAGVAAQILEVHYPTFKNNASKNMTEQVLDELIAASSPGIDMKGTGTPDRGLRSPYGTGITGAGDSDGQNDAVSFSDCPADSTCASEGFCGSFKSTLCVDGIQRPLGKEQCGRGVSCENGYCQSCGLNKEVCCSDQVKGSYRCATDTLRCSDTTGRCESCGGVGEPCCEGADDAKKCPGPNLTCGAGEVCQVCGKKGLQCCANSQCDNSLGCEMNTCVCGGVNQPCCGLDCYPGSQCDSLTKTCKQCGGSGQECCKSPAPACQGDMMCYGGKCQGPCYARCRNGLLLYGDFIHESSCRAFGIEKCDICSDVSPKLNDELLRLMYKTSYIIRENLCPPDEGEDCEACRDKCRKPGNSCKSEDRPTGLRSTCVAKFCKDGGTTDWCIHSRDSCQM